MKTTHPNTEETAVELNIPYHIVVQRLQQVQGTCSVTDSADESLYFSCDKSGNFTVDNDNPHSFRRRHTALSPYYVSGEVVAENGKTVVKFRCVHRSAGKVDLAVMLVGDLILLALYFLLNPITKASLILPAMFVILSASTLLSFFKKQTNGDTDTTLMKQEVLNRIEAVKRWEE
jgi:hypothetical protein